MCGLGETGKAPASLGSPLAALISEPRGLTLGTELNVHACRMATLGSATAGVHPPAHHWA